MFEQDVAGLIKALRANKNDELSVIHRALDECRKEIKSSDVEVKAAAVLKLVYLEMLGHSISFASFAIVECMTSTKYHIKCIGYLAASQCFDRETEVAVLVVNLVKKDLLQPPTPMFSNSPSSATVAHLSSTLSAVSLLLTPHLARDLAPELLSLLTHSRPLVRKQTTLVLFRVVRSWPGVKELSSGREEHGEDPWIERLRERLADQDQGVVSATVNLICELARKDPKKYLPLAPELFELLNESTNNWMLIKIIKLFAVLTPEEPRLVKKLVPPLTELIETTPAMSLLFECIQTSIVGGMLNGREGEALATTCVEKLKSFLEDIDQNLRYIALVALVKILPTHPHLVATHHDTILSCVDDPDMSIRMRALDLVEGMVDKRTLQSIVKRLMTHLHPPSSSTQSTAAAALLKAQTATNPDGSTPTAIDPSTLTLSPTYRSSLVSLILRMCASSTFSNVANFTWYIDTLVELAYLSLTISQDGSTSSTASLGIQIRDSLIDVVARVKAIRPYAVKKMSNLLGDETLLEIGSDANDIAEVLGAAAWICGEYCRELQDPRPVIASLFGTSPTSALPARILALNFHNGVKAFAYYLSTLSASWDSTDSTTLEQIKSLSFALEEQLSRFSSSSEIELQERSCSLSQTLAWVRSNLDFTKPTRKTSGVGFGSDPLDPYDPSKDSFDLEQKKEEPLSLRWLEPLFFSHELNPVNPKAQSMVAVPEGLDLNRSIVVRESSVVGMRDEEKLGLVDGFGRRMGAANSETEDEKRSKERKGKGKKKIGRSSKKRIVADEVEEEDPEEMARLRAERIERQRDDPYYVGSTPAGGSRTDDEIDSIPIVKLDLGTLPSRSAPPPPPREPTPPPVHIEVDGEMPDIPVTKAAAPIPDATVETEQIEASNEKEDIETQAQQSATVTKVVKKKKKSTATKGDGATGEKKTKSKNGSSVKIMKQPVQPKILE